MDQNELERLIRRAFNGVELDGGISINQSIVIDERRGDDMTEEEFEVLAQDENTTDWEKLNRDDLNRLEMPHVDGNGFRFYIPALLLDLLSCYQPSVNTNVSTEQWHWKLDNDIRNRAVVRNIKTISAIGFKEKDREYFELRFSSLNQAQREAIATYAHFLPYVVPLTKDDFEVVEGAFNGFWSAYFPSSKEE